MRRPFCAFAGLILLAAIGRGGQTAERTSDYAVEVSATVQLAPDQITLRWPADCGNSTEHYLVSRKLPGENVWGKPVKLPPNTTVFTDTKVLPGTAYEYQVARVARHCTGYGYLCTGINVPTTENRGRLLLLVDNTFTAPLSNELARLEMDLAGDGWNVSRFEINRTDTVVSVKSLIQRQYNADPTNVNCVFLFGHIPVPYSGDIVPDGHTPDHRGAWPCDGFYGDMDGTWTDQSVSDIRSIDLRNRNVPGDGKFDQSSFPAPLKLMVGRVDLSNLPGRLTFGGPPTFPSELELLRNYLDKDHKFRTAQFHLPRQGVLGDYFGVHDGEAFAASGWRNLSAFFGASNITCLPAEGTWIPTLSTNGWLCAYGCGAGTYTSIGGLGNANHFHDGLTTDLVKGDTKAVFMLLFGSWLGDWDSEDDLLRSVLALPSYGLASVWSGRPHWFLQHMAMGAPIGFSARLTQNNQPGGLYKTEVNTCAGEIHIALMGDPTLRLHPVAPPAHLIALTDARGTELSWTPSCDNSVLGYHVYRAASPRGPFRRLTTEPLNTTSYTDVDSAGASTYMVRAVKLETSASGTYFNPSQGTFASPATEASAVAQAASSPAHSPIHATARPIAPAAILPPPATILVPSFTPR